MALCKYIQRNGVRSFSVCCQHLSKSDLYKSYQHLEKQEKQKKSSQPLANWNENLGNMPWNENYEVLKFVKKTKKANKDEFLHFRDQLIMRFQRLGHIILKPNGIKNYVNKKVFEHEILKQSFFQERVDILGPDIGAAHFILNRGGRVKFWGHTEWITNLNKKKLLPYRYAPGLYIIALDATGTDLYYEGIDCLRYLNKLKWLRLRGLKNINDFSLDIISGRYGALLEYLDLTGCTGITHHGLESFYRFKCLKGLNVTGIDTTPEFHLTCLMLQDLLPDLEIIGADFSQYLKEEEEEEEEVGKELVEPHEVQGLIQDKSVM